MGRPKKLWLCVALMGLLILESYITLAQQTAADVCTPLVRIALSQAGNSCASISSNEACYGFSEVEALLIDSATDALTLDRPGSRIPLTEAAVISASRLSVASNTLGIGMIHTRANLPVGLDKNLVMVLIGEVEVENGVDPAQALILPTAALPVVTSAGSPVHDVPAASASAVGMVTAGTTLQADGISPDGAWLRVYFAHEIDYRIRAAAWISADSVASDADLDSLPVIRPDSQTPMQTFYLRNGLQLPFCQDMPAPPPMLYVQGPAGIETDFTVNGAHIRMSSSVMLRLLPPGNILELIALSGIVTLDPDSPAPMIVPAGFVTRICLTEPRNLGLDNRENDREIGPACVWSTPVQMNQTQLAAIRMLETIPANIMNDPLQLPRLICPSGVGEPVCQVIIDDATLLQDLRQLCSQGILPPFICLAISGL